MTGKYTTRLGLQNSVIVTGTPKCLPLDEVTLPERLRDAGYSTHLVGKWHLGMYNESCLPTNRGFDTAYGFYNGGQKYYYRNTDETVYNQPICDGKPIDGYDFHYNDVADFRKNGTYSTYVFRDRAVELITNHSVGDKPMFMDISFQAPHRPLQAPQKYIDMYSHVKDENRRIYSAMVTAVDDAIGEIIQALKSKNMYSDTLIVFSSDNGGDTWFGANNWPLRGDKNTLWEGGIRVAGFASGAGIAGGNRISKELIHISDWYPTLLHVAGVKDLTEETKLDGINIWEALSKHDGVSGRQELLHNTNPNRRRQTKPHDEYQKNPVKTVGFNVTYTVEGWDTTKGAAALRMGKWKLLTGDPGRHLIIPPDVNPQDEGTYDQLCSADPGCNDDVPWPSVRLYDIPNDPTESKNLANKYPDVVQIMLQKIADYQAESVPWENIPKDCKSDPALRGGVWRPWRALL